MTATTKSGHVAVITRTMYSGGKVECMTGHAWHDFGKREDGTRIPGPAIPLGWDADGVAIGYQMEQFDLEGGE